MVDKYGYSTGTLIDGRHILTSAHNVIDEGTQKPVKNGIDVLVEMPPVDPTVGTAVAIPTTFHVDAAHIHFDPLYDGGVTGDLGILTLDAPLPIGGMPSQYVPIKGVEPFSLRTTLIPTDSKPIYSLVGYGMTGTGATGAVKLTQTNPMVDPNNLKRVGKNTFDATAEILADEIVSLRIESTSGLVNGTFRLTFAGSAPSVPIPYDASAQTVEDALAGLKTIGTGNVRVRSDPRAAFSWLIDFGGGFRGTDVDTLLAVQNSLTGPGSPQVVKEVWRTSTETSTLPGCAVISDFDNGKPENDALGAEFGIPGLGLGSQEVASGPGDSGAPAIMNNQITAIVSAGYSGGIAAPGVKQPAVSQNRGSFGWIDMMNQVAYPKYQDWIDKTLAADNTGPYDLVLDMSKQAFGADGVADHLNINVSTVDGKLTITVFDTGHPYTLYNGTYAQVPASQVHDLVIEGTQDSEAVTVSGDLKISGAFKFQGGGGNDSLVLNMAGMKNSVPLPPGGILFDGGGGSNTLAVNDTSGLTDGTLRLSQLTLTKIDSLAITSNASFKVDTNHAAFTNMSLSQYGVLNLANPLTVNRSFEWGPGGTIKGTADLTTDISTITTFTYDSEKRLQGVRWDNWGKVAVIGPGNIALNNGAQIYNFGTFDLKTDAHLDPDEFDGDPGTEEFINAGLLVKSGGKGISGFGRNGNAHLALVNLGKVQVKSGTLRLSGDARGTGSMDIEGGTLELSLGHYDFPRAATVTGSGTLSGVGGDVTTIEGTISMLGRVNFGAGKYTVAAGGTIDARQGILIGSNATLTGEGKLVGTVTNAGEINPGSVEGLGTLTIQGDYIQIGSAVLWVELDQGGHSDHLIVSGSATIKGGLIWAQPLDPKHFRPHAGTTFTLLKAKSVTARVDQVEVPGVSAGPPTEPPIDGKAEIDGKAVKITYLKRT
jgi:hypothetical protein